MEVTPGDTIQFTCPVDEISNLLKPDVEIPLDDGVQYRLDIREITPFEEEGERKLAVIAKIAGRVTGD